MKSKGETLDDDRGSSEGATKIVYETYVYDEDLDRQFTDEEKIMLRPIAETLAMLDGNAFFGMNPGGEEREWYEQYLPEAYGVFKSNGGIGGWAGEVSWIKGAGHDNPAVKAAWEHYLAMRVLVKEEK